MHKSKYFRERVAFHKLRQESGYPCADLLRDEGYSLTDEQANAQLWTKEGWSAALRKGITRSVVLFDDGRWEYYYSSKPTFSLLSPRGDFEASGFGCESLLGRLGQD